MEEKQTNLQEQQRPEYNQRCLGIVERNIPSKNKPFLSPTMHESRVTPLFIDLRHGTEGCIFVYPCQLPEVEQNKAMHTPPKRYYE